MRKMKDSGIDWIGIIPEDWTLQKIGSVYEERNTKVSDTEYAPLSVTKQGIVPQLENAAKSDNGDNRKLILKNDFVINSRSDRRGSCGISEYDGSCSLINIVLNPRNSMNNVYYSYVFRSDLFADEFYRHGNGIVDDLWSTKWSSMKNIYIPYPTLNEQDKIAAFLENKCRLIDAVIEKHQHLISQLKSYKFSLITELLSKGQEGGLRYYVDFIEQGSSPSPAERNAESDWNVLSLAAVKNGSFNETALKPITDADASDKLRIKNGDFLMTRSNTRELVGDVCIVRNCPENTIFSDLIYRITFKDTIIPEYACYALRSASARQQIQEAARGSSGSMPKISHKSIKEIKIPVPSLDEQKKIVAILDKKCAAIDSSIAKRQQLIDKLAEYKKSLIFEVVTGKKEV